MADSKIIKTSSITAALSTKKTELEKAVFVAQELAKVDAAIIDRYAHEELEIEIDSVEYDEELEVGGMKGSLKVMARAFIGEKEIFVENPCYFFNPCYLVPDGTFQTIILQDGRTKDVPNFKEDKEESLRQMVGMHIKALIS